MKDVVTQRRHINELIQAGDFCFVSDGRVVMACPECSILFVCNHTIVQREPLTLSPSVVGPDRHYRDQVLPPCLHHFWVKDGKVIAT